MKINAVGSPNYISKVQKAPAAYAKGDIAVPRDEASISAKAASFSKVFAAIKDADDMHGTSQARIDELRQQIQDGSYSVDSGTLADSLIGSLLV